MKLIKRMKLKMIIISEATLSLLRQKIKGFWVIHHLFYESKPIKPQPMTFKKIK